MHGVGRYCPLQSASPIPVPDGWYSLPDTVDQLLTRSSIRQCGSGEYSAGGLKFPCDAGSYSLDVGRNTPCTMPCPPGTRFLHHSSSQLCGDVL